MPWHSPEDAMPWVGLYAGVASLVCTLAMAADLFQGVRKRKFWIPCRYFTINAASLTLIAVAMKLPVDLSTDLSSHLYVKARFASIGFLIIMLANFLPSLGHMNDKELVMNIIALGILLITIFVNVCIVDNSSTARNMFAYRFQDVPFFIFILLCVCSIALTIPTSRRILELKYQEMHKLALNGQQRKLSYEELLQWVKKYWMMAETGNYQFVVASTPICSASGVFCFFMTIPLFLHMYFSRRDEFFDTSTEYKWSTRVILATQYVGAFVGSIAPVSRSFIAFNYILSIKLTMNQLNMFRVENYWTYRLQQMKHNHAYSYIPGHTHKKVFHCVKNLILNFCIVLQMIVVVLCKTISLLFHLIAILISFFELLRRFINRPNATNNHQIEELDRYILQIKEDVKFSKGLLGNIVNSIEGLVHQSEKQEPRNLIKLLEKSTEFKGVIDFDTDHDQVPRLHAEETLNCWSLVAVNLTAIAISLPNIEQGKVKGLLASMSEGISFIRHVEDNLNTNADFVNIRKAANYVWADVELYCKWLDIDLQKNPHRGNTSKEILQWWGDEAAQIVIQFMSRKIESSEYKLYKFIAANSMYRISRTMLFHCNGQESWPNDEQLFERISTAIADILCACFTNIPRVITLKCHDNVIGQREESIKTAARLLGRSKKILSILQERELPSLDPDSMAYIDEWHALLKSQNTFYSASSSSLQPSPSSSSEFPFYSPASSNCQSSSSSSLQPSPSSSSEFPFYSPASSSRQSSSSRFSDSAVIDIV